MSIGSGQSLLGLQGGDEVVDLGRGAGDDALTGRGLRPRR